MALKITYDTEVDAMYIYLNENKILDTEEHRPGFIMDYDKHGGLVGIELLDASKKVADLTTVQYESV